MLVLYRFEGCKRHFCRLYRQLNSTKQANNHLLTNNMSFTVENAAVDQIDLGFSKSYDGYGKLEQKFVIN